MMKLCRNYMNVMFLIDCSLSKNWSKMKIVLRTMWKVNQVG